MNLTEQQTRFCEEYLIDHDATAAAERAGYAKSTAKKWGERLMGNVLISEHIDQLLHEDAAGAEQQFVVSHLKQLVERCLEPNRMTKCCARKQDCAIVSGENCCAAYEPDMASAYNALELLGRHFGMFETPNKYIICKECCERE